jgi:thymidylate kinase
MDTDKLLPYLISFEGLDAVGKTTLANGLFNYLTNASRVPVKIFPEFSDSAIGELLIELIRKFNFIKLDPISNTPLAETLLLIADLCVKSELMESSNKKLPIIIADRYFDSLIAYQVPRILRNNPNLDMDNITKWLTDFAEPILLKPNITFLIDLPMEVICSRVKFRDSYQPSIEDLEFFEQAYSIFTTLMKKDCQRFYQIDGGRNANDILVEIIDVVTQRLLNEGIVQNFI